MLKIDVDTYSVWVEVRKAAMGDTCRNEKAAAGCHQSTLFADLKGSAAAKDAGQLMLMMEMGGEQGGATAAPSADLKACAHVHLIAPSTLRSHERSLKR